MSKSTSIDDLPSTDQPNITLETSEKPIQPSAANTDSPSQQPVQLSSTDINKIVQGIQLASSNNMTTLPSKDIPINTNNITNDPQVQPNFVPQEDNKGFVEDFDAQQALLYKQQNGTKTRY